LQCTLEVITPVHIGNGTTYGPQEFYTGKAKSGDKLVPIFGRVDVSKLYSELDDDARDELVDHISTQDFRLDSMEKFKKAARRAVRYRGFLKTESSNIKDVHEHIKTSDEIYIPGSSIKGSIRTALLYKNLRDSDLERISEEVSRGHRGDPNKIINSFFSSDPCDTAKKSIMRFLEVTDTNTSKAPALHMVRVLTVSGGSYSYKKFPLYLEFIPRKKLEFEMNFTYNDVYDRIGNKRELVDPETDHGGGECDHPLENKRELVDPETIRESLYTFSRDYIEHELDFASRYGVDFLERIYRKLEKRNSPENPLMRIGQGSGFLATTIGLRFKEDDYRTYESIRKVSRGRSYPYEFPKTRKLIDGRIPPGWVKAIFNG
jgi:CRISPR-associated protein Csm5